MGNYKVLKPFFKLSEKKNYFIDDIIELSIEDAQNMLEYIDAETFGITTNKKTEEADKEIKESNKLLVEVSKKDVEDILNKPKRKIK